MFKFLQAEEGIEHAISPFGCLLLCIKKYHKFGHIVCQKISSEKNFSFIQKNTLFPKQAIWGNR